MVGQTLHDVVGVEERLFDETAEMLGRRRVEDAVAFPAGVDETGKAKFGEMLGDRRGLRADVVRQLVDSVLPVEKGPQDA